MKTTNTTRTIEEAGAIIAANCEESVSELYDYAMGTFIRPATEEEANASAEAARHDGGAGVIEVDGRRCFVR